VKLDGSIIEELEVSPGDPADLGRRSTDSTKIEWLEVSGLHRKNVAEQDLASYVEELKAAQELLWASDTYALLVVLQAMDAGGKDGTIKHVMSGLNPQGCQVTVFKQPSVVELGHDFLWRCSNALPERGGIGIFNRSYYEEVLVVRVHPELLADRHGGPNSPPPERLWRDRFEDINAFERHLHRNGTRIVKIFLHLSKEEQRRRLLARLDDPAKLWKFSTADQADRSRWDEYMVAYEEAIAATSTQWAPWYVVPADHKYASRALVGGILVHAVDQMDLQLPTIGPDQAAALDRARSELRAE
jgi:PPK2 family polyphosphate:nucleotide phosphotransferase